MESDAGGWVFASDTAFGVGVRKLTPTYRAGALALKFNVGVPSSPQPTASDYDPGE